MNAVFQNYTVSILVMRLRAKWEGMGEGGTPRKRLLLEFCVQRESRIKLVKE
jgi:hypothetical protein